MCPSKLELASNGMTINLIRLILLPLPYFFVRLFVLTKDLFTLLAFVMSFIRFVNILNYYKIMFFFMLWKSEIEKNTKVCVLLKNLNQLNLNLILELGKFSVIKINIDKYQSGIKVK